mgnify:CR=1 FL=1
MLFRSFDRPDAGLMEVLSWAARVAEPAIVGDVDQQPWSIALVDHCSGENRLVAHENADCADAVDGDPLQDITELERVRWVMKGGIVFKK